MLRVIQFRSGGCFSYLVFDYNSREALILDPVLGICSEIENNLLSLGLKTKYILDSHTHADHPSGSSYLKNSVGGVIAMSALTGSKRSEFPLSNGSTLLLGEEKLNILSVPGHTPDHIALHTDKFVFTGDTLHVGTTARTDFVGSSAETMYDSLKEEILQLRENLIVYPGHDYSDYLFSSIGIEKNTNSDLRFMSKDSFAEFKTSQKFEDASLQISQILEFNRKIPADFKSTSQFADAAHSVPCSIGNNTCISLYEVNPAIANQKMMEGKAIFVDVREPNETEIESFPFGLQIPLSDISNHIHEFDKSKLYFFACKSGKRSLKAQKTLSLFGIKGLSVQGGIELWRASGLLNPTLASDAII